MTKLTKHEYVALEIFKHKNLSVGEAWDKAAELLEKSKAPQIEKSKAPQTKPASARPASNTARRPASNTASMLDVDLSTLYLNCIPQGKRRLSVGQVWYNWHRDYSETIVELGTSSKSGTQEINSRRLASIAPIYNNDLGNSFLTDGWEWELLKDNESHEECKKRVITERERLARLDVFQTTPFDEIGKSADFDFTVRTTNILKSLGIYTYAELLKHSSADLLKKLLFGKKCLDEVTALLRSHNLYLGMLKTDTN